MLGLKSMNECMSYLCVILVLSTLYVTTPGVYGVRIEPFPRALRRVSNNALGGGTAAGRGGG